MKRIYWKLNAIIGFVVLIVIDFMTALFTDVSWREAHDVSMKAIKNSWYKY